LLKAQSESPDVIISDISMPGMDGLEMIRALKTNDRTKYIPIICASAAFHDLATKVKALTEAGAEEFFYLPQSEEELLLKVAVMLRIRQLYLDLLDKNKQLKIFNDAAVGREMVMIEQKEQIERLEKELKKYRPGS
jgi:response regulator RpfG family c-di-GMP phosphodiesterase